MSKLMRGNVGIPYVAGTGIDDVVVQTINGIAPVPVAQHVNIGNATDAVHAGKHMGDRSIHCTQIGAPPIAELRQERVRCRTRPRVIHRPEVPLLDVQCAGNIAFIDLAACSDHILCVIRRNDSITTMVLEVREVTFDHHLDAAQRSLRCLATLATALVDRRRTAVVRRTVPRIRMYGKALVEDDHRDLPIRECRWRDQQSTFIVGGLQIDVSNGIVGVTCQHDM